MSLVHFLRGAAPRPNPEAPWRLQYRRAEGGAWETLVGLAERGLAKDELLAPCVPLARGDLLRLRYRDLATEEAWVVTAAGPVRLGGVDPVLPAPDGDWTTGWEAPGVAGLTLMEVAARAGVGRRWLTSLACACARGVEPLLAREALEGLGFVEAWARTAPEDRAAPEDASALRQWMQRAAQAEEEARRVLAADALGAEDKATALATLAAVASAQRAISVPTAHDPAGRAETSVRYAAEAYAHWRVGDGNAFMASILRAHLPISLLLLAVAGDPEAPSSAG